MIRDKQKTARLPASMDAFLGGIITLLKRIRTVMTSIIIWLVGFLFVGLGIWIIMLRSEEFLDKFWPHNILVGQMTVDGRENKGYAELLRARFDYHFRRPVAIPAETGFLEVLTLDTPELFQRGEIQQDLLNMNIEVGGVDVGYIVRLANKVLQPDRWIIEGDFQIKPDRALLALRMMRGRRLIRTWYLERLGNTDKEKSILLEQLIDDAIFQLAYDFANIEDKNKDIVKWRNLLPIPDGMAGPRAVAAYFEARAALGRYYAQGSWSDLDLAIEHLRFLRRQMPEYKEGLQMLAVALAEQRNETDAIHVYEQLLLLLPSESSHPEEACRRHAIQLLKAIATTNLYTPASAHAAIADLEQLDAVFEAKSEELETTGQFSKEKLAYLEMRAHTAVQLSYTYGLYLSYVSRHQIAKMFGDKNAPQALRIQLEKDIETLNNPDRDTQRARTIVIKTIQNAARLHRHWVEESEKFKRAFDQYFALHAEKIDGGKRRRKELAARLNLSKGYAYFRMAEIENSGAALKDTIFGMTYDELLIKSAERLLEAESDHANHYQVLQLLGQVYSEPRRENANSSIAEQYFERAIAANPSDYWGHVLLANLIYRRVLGTGLDLESRNAIQKGLSLARAAVESKEISGSAQLLKAKFLAAMLAIERDKSMQQELALKLDQSIEQAARFLPLVFKNEDVDLAWLRLIVSHRKSGIQLQAAGESGSDRQGQVAPFETFKADLMSRLEQLILNCERIEKRWIAQQRVFHVSRLKQKAIKVKAQIKNTEPGDWDTIHIDLM